MLPTQLLALGCGYVATALARRLAARGVATLGTARSREACTALAQQGVTAIQWPGADLDPPEGAAWLISVPPDDEGCPLFRALQAKAPGAAWIGYLSTTGVYGDLAGGWAFEETPRNPQSSEETNRARAADQWL